ncbi:MULTISPECIES: LacI family DNA-binding transcriptional regulator [unclassified Bacillus (in: firmicutes)]|uniref:LacI family DNA-binding transcriptional regulator n=1 Tax=unclassified Bacillus (in: firmicutes) TaxID=185979 RepID=UPI0008F30BD2|nr:MULTISPECIES: LacI family DNA-binding transcriptional regulator [unclassified Bacillus (in: firmicutes)]SFA89936.1 regulatory protein, lacI family [Bacillus sp. UNCCL13]SFQ85090.1 regulatory protein, lacI family [Bacillus sp. cl95]
MNVYATLQLNLTMERTMKKVTMKDIALEANVSVATVSYIINNVKTQTIPQETRERVLEIVKRLNYVPNLAARSLVKQKTGLMGILVNREENQGFWRRFHYADFISELEGLLAKKGYHVLLYSLDAENPNPQIILERKLDGVFLIDPSEESFHNISRQFPLVPLVVIDSHIDDPLFFKVLPDFKSAMANAIQFSTDREFVLVVEKYNNLGIIKTLYRESGLEPDNIFTMSNEADLKHFLSIHKGKKVIAVNEFIGVVVAKYAETKDMIVICTSGCPEILPMACDKITFTRTKAVIAEDIMAKILEDDQVDKLDKFVYLVPSE